MNEKNPLRVGFPGFEGLIALDLVGPIDAFTSAFMKGRNGEMSNCYEVVIIGLSGQRSLLNPAFVFKPHKTIRNAPPLDTLIIPGGKGLRVFETDSSARIPRWWILRDSDTAGTGLITGRNGRLLLYLLFHFFPERGAEFRPPARHL